MLSQEIARQPFSTMSIKDFLAPIAARYPGLEALRALQCSDFSDLTPFGEFNMQPWLDYSEKIANCLMSEDLALVYDLARRDHLKPETISSYLQLLSGTSGTAPLCADIHTITDFQSTTTIPKVTSRPLIIPYSMQSAPHHEWAFIVVYPDCLHWYDSREGVCVPRFESLSSLEVQTSWSGPKLPQNVDSGLMMLVGIRLISQGLPHLCQSTALFLNDQLRCRVLAELRFQTLSPSTKHLSKAQRERPGISISHHFNEAFGSDYLQSPTATTSRRSSRESILEAENSPSSLADEPLEQPTANTSRRFSRERRALDRVRIPGSTDAARLISSRTMMVSLLHSAVIAKRHFTSPEQTDITILWEALKENSRSVLHERYVQATFVRKLDEMDNYSSQSYTVTEEMRHASQKFRIWKDICELGKHWGDASCVLLCAISPNFKLKTPDQNARLVEAVRNRLDVPRNSFLEDLDEAKTLCSMVLRGQMPTYQLMIESYPYKRHEEMTDQFYKTLMGLDERPRMALP